MTLTLSSSPPRHLSLALPVLLQLLLLLSLLINFSFGATEEEQNNIGMWENCTQTQFIKQLKSTSNIYKPMKIPGPIGCESITIPRNPKVYQFINVGDTFPVNEFRFRRVENICELNKVVEGEVNFNCVDLCLDNTGFEFNNSSNNGTSIYDWVNYCQYCRNANGFERYHEFRLNNQCNNSKVVESRTILNLIQSFPNDIRYCGSVNIGLPVLVGPLFDDFAIVCYCEQASSFEFECRKRGWNDVLNNMLDIGGMVAYCLLFIISFSILFIPKLVNLIKRTPGFSFLLLLPSISLVFSSACYIVNYTMYFSSIPWLASTFLMMGEFMIFYSLFPILMRWYSMTSLIKMQQQGKSNNYPIKKVYIASAALFVLMTVFVVVVTVVIPILVGDRYFFEMYIGISWLTEVSFLLMFIFTSQRLKSVLKKLSDVSSHTIPFSGLSNFSIIFILVLSFFDFSSLFARLSNDRIFNAYSQLLTDTLYCSLFCRIVLFEFNVEDFSVFKKNGRRNTAVEEDIPELIQNNSTEQPTSGTSVEGHTSSDYYLLK